jgi:hypothetical protein
MIIIEVKHTLIKIDHRLFEKIINIDAMVAHEQIIHRFTFDNERIASISMNVNNKFDICRVRTKTWPHFVYDHAYSSYESFVQLVEYYRSFISMSENN